MNPLPTSTEPANRRLRMSVDFLFGRGYLTLRQHALADGCSVPLLRMEIPDLRFPFDVRSGLERFRRVRCHLQRARVVFSESRLQLNTPSLASLHAFGVRDLTWRFGEGEVRITLHLQQGGAESHILATLVPFQDPNTPAALRWVTTSTIAFGVLPMPAPVLVQEVLRSWFGHLATPHDTLPSAQVSFHRASFCTPVDRWLVSALFLPFAWKLPATETLRIASLDLRPGRLCLDLAGEGPTSHHGEDDLDPLSDILTHPKSHQALALWDQSLRHAEAEEHFFAGAWPEALARYEAAEAKGGATHWTRRRRIELLLLDESHEELMEAAALLHELLDRRPNDLSLLANAVRVAEALHQEQEANKWRDAYLRHARAERAHDEEVLGWLASALHERRNHRPEQALPALDAALRLAPRHRILLETKADIARSIGSFTLLEDTLRRLIPLIEERQRLSATTLELCHLIIEHGRGHDEVIEHLERLTNIDDLPADDTLQLGDLWRRIERPTDALRAYQRIHGRPDDAAPEVWNRACLALAKLWCDAFASPDNALDLLHHGLERCPEHPAMALYAMHLAQGAGRSNDVLRIGARLLEAHSGPARHDTALDADERKAVLTTLARAEEARQRPDLAAAYWQQVLDLDPEDRDAWRALDHWLRQSGQPQDLVDTYRAQLDRTTEPAQRSHLVLALADVYERGLGLSSEAAALLEEAVEANPEDVALLHRLVALLDGRSERVRLLRILQAQHQRPRHRAAQVAWALATAKVAHALQHDSEAADAALNGLKADPGHPELLEIAALTLSDPPERERILRRLVDRTESAMSGRWLAELATCVAAQARSEEAQELARRALAAPLSPSLRASLESLLTAPSERAARAAAPAWTPSAPWVPTPLVPSPQAQVPAPPSAERGVPAPHVAETHGAPGAPRTEARVVEPPTPAAVPAPVAAAPAAATPVAAAPASAAAPARPQSELAISERESMLARPTPPLEAAATAPPHDENPPTPSARGPRFATQDLLALPLQALHGNVPPAASAVPAEPSRRDREIEEQRAEMRAAPAEPSRRDREIEEQRAEMRAARARQSGDHEELVEALRSWAAVVDEAAQRAAILSELGQVLYHDLEEGGSAAGHLEEARRLDPEGVGKDQALLGTLEALYDDVGDAANLLEIYRQKMADAGDAQMRNVYRVLMATTLLERLQAPQEALALTEDVLREEPQHSATRRLRAEIFESIDAPEEAARELREVLASPETDTFEALEVRRILGRLCWLRLGHLDEASEAFETILADIPGDTEAVSTLKQIYGSQGRLDRCTHIILKEIGILAGRLEGFGSVDELLDVLADAIPQALRETAAQILQELLSVGYPATVDDRQCEALLRWVEMHLPGEPTLLETKIKLLRQRGDQRTLAAALRALAAELLDRDEVRKLLEEAAALDALQAETSSVDEAPARTHHVLARDVADDTPRGAPALDADQEYSDGSQPSREDPEESDHRGAADEAPRGGAALSEEIGPSPRVAEPGEGSGGGPALPALAPATSTPDRGLAPLDHLALTGRLPEALHRLNLLLPATAEPAARRSLLVRKGLWLLQSGRPTAEGLLVLKGALILDEDATDTRLALAFAYASDGDSKRAKEQLLLWAEASGESLQHNPLLPLLSVAEALAKVLSEDDLRQLVRAWRDHPLVGIRRFSRLLLEV